LASFLTEKIYLICSLFPLKALFPYSFFNLLFLLVFSKKYLKILGIRFSAAAAIAAKKAAYQKRWLSGKLLKKYFFSVALRIY